MGLLIIFLPEILTPACDSSSLAFHIMSSAYKQSDNIQPSCMPFPILNQFVAPHLLLDLHIGFAGDRSGGMIFPSLEEFSTVCCDPHSQRLLG